MKHLENLDKSMDINQYKVIITPTAYKEINQIYDYISENLYARKAAHDLMEQVELEIKRLKTSPEIYTEIEKIDELKRRYRRIVIKNYVILYTIDNDNQTVYVAHMYYGRRNYLSED